MKTAKRAVVIGSGFGGLAIANRLQALGVEVTVLEKRDQVGGRAGQFREAGYTFDMGPSLITAPDIIESIFAAAGRSMHEFFSLMPLDPYYRVYFHDGTHFDYSGDADAMKRQMAQFNPQDAAQYDAFMEALRPIYDTVITDGMGARPFDTMASMARFVPRALALKAYLPVARYVERYFKDFRHRFLFSFHPLFIGGDPFRAPSIYLMIPYLEAKGGVWFTRGGMYTVVEALAQLLIEQGGRIHTGCEVDEIVVRDGQAVGVAAGDRFFEADIVVSNADVAHTYGALTPARARRKWTDRRLARLDQSMSCFLLYLGVRDRYPHLKHHTLILSERYRDLVRDIFRRKILPDDFSMYLHAPAHTDPAMAPPGCESLYVLIPVANAKSGIDWSEMGDVLADRVIDFLEQWGLEGLRANLEVRRTYTPADFEKQLNATDGNAFGIEPRLGQTAYFRPHNRSEDIGGLYFVGAGTHPGAGVPGVMLSAEAAEFCIRHDLGLGQSAPVIARPLAEEVKV
jgi:phytoene desaturase